MEQSTSDLAVNGEKTEKSTTSDAGVIREKMESSTTLDRGVFTVLKGVDLEKYIPLFEKFKITMELFLSLTEEDLRAIGVENPDDLDLLLKYISKFQRNTATEQLEPLKQEDIVEMLENTRNHLQKMDIAVSYVSSKMNPNNTIDFVSTNGKSFISAITMFCDRTNKENDEFVSEIDKVIQEMDKKRKNNFSGKLLLIGFTTLSVLVSFSVAAILGYKKYH